MTPSPTLLDLVREAWPRIERMGVDAIAQAHAVGVSAWVSDGEGRIVRLDPDGTEHVERRAVAVGDLTDAEATAIAGAEPDGPGYELDDIDEDGRWKPGRRPAWWPGSP